MIWAEEFENLVKERETFAQENQFNKTKVSIDAILTQDMENGEKVTSYSSGILNGAEHNYFTTEK